MRFFNTGGGIINSVEARLASVYAKYRITVLLTEEEGMNPCERCMRKDCRDCDMRNMGNREGRRAALIDELLDAVMPVPDDFAPEHKEEFLRQREKVANKSFGDLDTDMLELMLMKCRRSNSNGKAAW
jgi:hypothetical protein